MSFHLWGFLSENIAVLWRERVIYLLICWLPLDGDIANVANISNFLLFTDAFLFFSESDF